MPTTNRPTYYTEEIQYAAEGAGLDPTVVTALVLVESSGYTHSYRYEPEFWTGYLADHPKWKDHNPMRVSASYGLMQILYVTAVERGYQGGDPEFLFVPRIGLRWGCKHLRWLLDRADGAIDVALAAYNGGVGGNRLAGKLRNERYADKVLARMGDVPNLNV